MQHGLVVGHELDKPSCVFSVPTEFVVQERLGGQHNEMLLFQNEHTHPLVPPPKHTSVIVTLMPYHIYSWALVI